MEWDESKHPRDKQGRFTDGSSLAQEYIPNPEIQELNTKSIEELKEIAIKSTGKSRKPPTESKAIHIGTVNFADKNSVISTLEACESVLINLPYEVNITITTDGRIWQVNGDSASVNPSVIPHSLEGSYAYHNHPREATWYSFSCADVAFFLTMGEQYSKASDDKFEYVMIRTAGTKAPEFDNIYSEYDKAFAQVNGMGWDELINMDIDGHHETIKILAEVFNFYYERKEKNK